MNNKSIKILISYLMIMIQIIGLVSCSKKAIVQETTISNQKEISIPEEVVEPVPIELKESIIQFEDFDSDYMNLISMNSSLVAYKDAIFYTTGNVLYRYDVQVREKTEITNMLIAGNIYLIDNYVYYLTEKSLRRINIVNSNEEEVIKANETCKNTFAYSSDRFYRYELMDYIIVEGVVIIDYHASTLDDGQEAQMIGKLDDLVFYHNYSERFDPRQLEYGEVPFINLEKVLETETEDNEEGFDYSEWHMDTIRHFYLVDEHNEKKTIELTYYIDSAEISHYSSSVNGDLVLSGDKVYCANWPQISTSIYGYRLNSNEQIYEKYVEGAVVSMNSINQYVIFNYYDRKKVETLNTSEGVIIIDAKNNIVYENDEINKIISGDIDYKNLIHMNFYLDGEILYAVESDLIEISRLESTESEWDDAKKNGLVFFDYQSVEGHSSKPSYFCNSKSDVNIYIAKVEKGRLNFTQIYKEFEK